LCPQNSGVGLGDGENRARGGAGVEPSFSHQSTSARTGCLDISWGEPAGDVTPLKRGGETEEEEECGARPGLQAPEDTRLRRAKARERA
jgi:hypothetical protein